MIASGVNYAVETRGDTGSYRIPIGIQFAWGLILAIGLFFLPDSPRYFVKRGQIQQAAHALSRLRGQPIDSEYIQVELSEIVANEEYERRIIPDTGFFGSWMNCFTGSLWQGKSNLRRTILGTSLQMMQQWTGVNVSKFVVKTTSPTPAYGIDEVLSTKMLSWRVWSGKTSVPITCLLKRDVLTTIFSSSSTIRRLS